MSLGLTTKDLTSIASKGTAVLQTNTTFSDSTAMSMPSQSLGMTETVSVEAVPTAEAASLPAVSAFFGSPVATTTTTTTTIATVVAPSAPSDRDASTDEANASKIADTDADPNFVLNTYKIELSIYYGKTDELVDLSEYVISVNIIANYDDHVIPFFEFELVLPKTAYSDLMKFYREATAIVRLQQAVSKPKAPPGTPVEVLPAVPCVIVDVQGEPVDGLSSDVTEIDPTLPLVLYIATMHHLKATKSVINRIFTNATMEQVVGQIVSSTSPLKVFMAKPDNVREYEQVIIPPFSARMAIEYLQSKYGVYRTGLRLFYGFHYAYVMDRRRGASPSGERSECIVECIDVMNETAIGSDGSFDDKAAGVCRIRTTQPPMLLPTSVSQNEVDGEALTFGSSTQRAHSDACCNSSLVEGEVRNDPSAPKERVYWNASSSDFAEEEFLAKHREDDQVTVQMTGIDIKFLTPDKSYRLKFSSKVQKPHEGTYRLSACAHKFIRTSGDPFSAIVSIAEFRVVEKEAIAKQASGATPSSVEPLETTATPTRSPLPP